MGRLRAESPAEDGGGREVLHREVPSLFGHSSPRLDFSPYLTFQLFIVPPSSNVSFKVLSFLATTPGEPILILSASPSACQPKVWLKPSSTFDNDLALL